MKKVSFFLGLFFISGLLIFSSCEKAIEEIAEIIPTLSCDIDGTNWSTHSVIGSQSDTGIVFMAFEDTIMVSLVLKEVAVGTYTIDNFNNFATYSYDESFNIFVGTSGTVSVTNINEENNRVDLSFNFKGFNLLGDSVNITNGTGDNLLSVQ